MNTMDGESLNQMVEKNSDNIKTIEEMDKQLIAIQQSTRTLFKLFQPFHEKARENWKWYYKWHIKPSTNKVHWTVFGLCNIVAIIGILSVVLTPTNLTKATAEMPIVSSNTGVIANPSPITADKSVGNDIDTVGTITSGVWNGTDIAWLKISKTNSSLADLDARSAGDLNSGTLADSLLSNNVTKSGNTFNNAGQLVQLNTFGYLPAINGAALTNLTQSQIGLSNVENTALSTWTGSTNIASLGTVNTGTWKGTAIADNYINSAANWNSAFTHISDTNNPHSLTASQVLPDQVGQSSKILSTNGTNVFWTNDLNSAAWGTIAGTLSAQSDLNVALFGKEPTLAAGTISQYYRGDKTWAVLDKTAVGLSNVENIALSNWAGSANITNLGTINTGAWNGSTIAWGKINKTGSSLADITIRSASDLDSGTLSDSRLSANVTKQGNAFNNAGQLVQLNTFGYLPAINGAALTNLTKSQVGLSNVENTALSNWAGSTNITNLGTINTGAWNGSIISWGKIDKTGSSLADFTTRSAGDLNSGTLSDSRLSTNVTLLGNLTTGTGSIVNSVSPILTGNLGIYAHIKSTQTTAPTISSPLRCGTAGQSASVTIGSTDLVGSFTINAGTGTPRDTCNTTITFNTAYGTAPKAVILSPGNSDNAAHREINVSAVTTTSFTIKMNVNPAASEVNTWYYWVIE